MKTESALPEIILVCSFVQIILGIGYFIDYELLIQFSLAGITATVLMFVFISLLNPRPLNRTQLQMPLDW